KAGPRCPAGRSSASPSPEPCSRTPPSSSWTRPPRPWTPRTRPGSPPPPSNWPASAPCWSSPTGRPPSQPPTRSSSWRAGGSRRPAPRPSCSPGTAATPPSSAPGSAPRGGAWPPRPPDPAPPRHPAGEGTPHRPLPGRRPPMTPTVPERTGADEALRFPLTRPCPFTPPDAYQRMRGREGLTRAVIPSGEQVWLVARHADVRAALSHPAASSDARHPAFPALGEGEQAVAADLRPFIRMDPPDHTRVRRMLVGEFTVKRVREMRLAIEEICAEQADRLLTRTPPADLVGEYANRVSTTVICRLLGVPVEDLDFFRRITSVSGSRTSTEQEVNAALADLFGLIDRLIDEKSADPGDDLISRLATGPLARGEITRRSLLSQIGITLNAGHETSRNMIPLAALALLRHPDQLARLREDPSLWPGAV